MASREGSYRYGQLVIGPPGSGKSTYCAGMKQFLSALGRNVSIVNLDPANHVLPYPCDVNMAELITLDDAMTSLGLGPNGGLLYCMDFLHSNVQWLFDKLQLLQDDYIVFDCPGQVELYTHNHSVKAITEQLGHWNIKVPSAIVCWPIGFMVQYAYVLTPAIIVIIVCLLVIVANDINTVYGGNKPGLLWSLVT